MTCVPNVFYQKCQFFEELQKLVRFYYFNRLIESEIACVYIRTLFMFTYIEQQMTAILKAEM